MITLTIILICRFMKMSNKVMTMCDEMHNSMINSARQFLIDAFDKIARDEIIDSDYKSYVVKQYKQYIDSVYHNPFYNDSNTDFVISAYNKLIAKGKI